jgi:hypothetical protein
MVHSLATTPFFPNQKCPKSFYYSLDQTNNVLPNHLLNRTAPAEVKAEEINLKVRAAGGNELSFKLKKVLGKIFDAYHKKTGTTV